MKELTLLRYAVLSKYTLGILVVKEKRVADTLELPWQNNTDNISCIPAGIYSYKIGKQNKEPHADCINIENVPNRNSIQIHAGNYLSEIKGCILPGEIVLNSIMVANSKATLHKILTMIPQKGEIEIKEV